MIGIYHKAALICGVLAFLFLMGAILLFFWFRIPRTLDFLSGRTAKRSIRRMQREMEPALGQERDVKREPETEVEGEETTLFLKGLEIGGEE